jgi:hypothetical protein
MATTLLIVAIAAPWVPAIVYYARRAPKTDEAYPTSAELSQRRLWA